MERMRGCTVVLVCLLFSSLLMSQVKVAALASANYTSLLQNVEGKAHIGAQFGYGLGVLCEMPLKKGFMFRPEIGVLSQGGNYYSRKYSVSETTLSAPMVNTTFYSIQMPLNFSYKMNISDMSLSILLGPAVHYSFAGELSSGDVLRSIDYGTEASDDYLPFDLAMTLGMVAEYKDLFFQLSIQTGVFDRSSVRFSDESRLYQNNVLFSIGYFFM